MRLIRHIYFRIGFAFVLAVTTIVGHVAGEGWSLDGDKKHRIDALFDEWNSEESPGAAIGISERGTILYARGYGCANLDHAVPMRPNSSFYIASTSKPDLLVVGGVMERVYGMCHSGCRLKATYRRGNR